MTQQPPQQDIGQPLKQRAPAPALTSIKTLIATAITLGLIGGFTYLNNSSALISGFHHSGDEMDSSAQRERSEAFAAIGSLNLKAIADAEIDTAIDTMQLDPKSKQALKVDIAPVMKVVPAAAKPDTFPKPANDISQPSSIRLVWISVWDTDAEDGDVIKITSQGYSRKVTLTKKPIPFAIPVPTSGVINITGIRDGEGGGITVGLESGTSQAIFPIMSVGQTLGLHVVVN